MTRHLELATFSLLAASSLALAGCAQPLPSMPGQRWEDGRVIVKFKDGTDPATMQEVRAAIGTAGYEKLPLVGADALLFDPATAVDDAVGSLGAWGDVVEYAEPDFIQEAQGTPSDFDGAVLWGLARIQAPGAWEKTLGSAEIIVAITDTGVDVSHPDLAPNIWRNPGEIAGNGVDDDGNGYRDDVTGWDFVDDDARPDDEVGHGTHVAGTIGASGNDGGVVGVSPNVRLMPLQTLAPYGGSTSGSIKAIDYARRNGARVINASWGSYGYSNALKEAIYRAGQQGILFVAASGNQGVDADASPMFPAAYDLPNVISVGASGGSDKLLSFSNYGRATVDLVAPGAEIASTYPGGDYVYMDGTSMATPHVAGAAALVLAANPTLSATRVKEILLGTVDATPDAGGRTVTGGRLNVSRAVAAAMPDSQPEPEPEPEPSTWSWAAVAGGSDHPYANDVDATWSAQEPGASELKLRFSRVSTEPGYDYVILYDGAGNEVARYDGEKGDLETVSVPGDTVYIRLVTDESITGYGFEVSEFGWR